MRLSDIMSHAGLSGYAIVAMVLFIVAFGGIVWKVFQRSNRDEYEHARRLPLEDGTPPRSPGDSK